MAKIKFGMMMTDARGKLGGQVFSKNRAGAYVRTKVTPVNPQTAAQSRVRSNLALFSGLWNGLSEAERQSFNSSVEAWQTTDIFGDIKKPSGKNLYTKLNLNLRNSGQAPVTTAPDKVEIPVFLDTSATLSATADSITIAGLFPGSLGRYQIEATPPLNQGVSFAKNRFRVIEYVNQETGTTADVYNSYVAKFGEPASGDNIQFRIKFIAANGQAGPAYILKMVSA